MQLTDQTLADFVQRGDRKAFEEIFNAYYRPLHAYAFTMLGDDAMADECVQEVFFKLWSSKNRLTITHSLKAYLYRSIYNQCMTHVRQQQQKTNYRSHVLLTKSSHAASDGAELKIELNQLQQKLQQSMNSLPEACRTIFYLSRFEELTYQDIASQLGLSVKTVEAQISKALKRLRISLIEFI